MLAADKSKYVRARERNRARIAALNQSAPIAELPAEIRASIFAYLSPIQQFKINYYPELRWMFNPFDEWNIGQGIEDPNFSAIMLLYEEAQLFDKIAAKVALLRIMQVNIGGRIDRVLDILGRCNPMRYYSLYNEDEYSENEYEPLLMYVIYSIGHTTAIDYDFIIIIKMCFILIKKKQQYYITHFPSDEACIWSITNGKFSIITQRNVNEIWVGVGWELYYELIRRMGYVLDICNVSYCIELEDQLIALYKQYFLPDFNGVKSAIVRSFTSDYGRYRALSDDDCPKYKAYLSKIEQLIPQ